MLTLQKIVTLEVTPEKFVDNCSATELQEVILLANARLGGCRINASTVSCQILEAERREEPAPAAVLSEPAVEPEQPVQAAAKAAKRPAANLWTSEEDEQLRRLYPLKTAKKIYEIMNNRSMRAIIVRANILGIRKYRLKAQAPSENQAPARKTRANRHGGNYQDELLNRKEQAEEALQTVKQREAGKPMRSLRVDKRTTVLVPADTNDAEYIANYKKKYC